MVASDLRTPKRTNSAPKRTNSAPDTSLNSDFGTAAAENSTPEIQIQMLRINANGKTYILNPASLQRYPDTLLGHFASISHEEKLKVCDYYIAHSNEYGFYRSKVLFDAISVFFATGILHLPDFYCKKQLMDELKFWQVPIKSVSECCVHKLNEGPSVQKLNEGPSVAENSEIPQNEGDGFRRFLTVDQQSTCLTTCLTTNSSGSEENENRDIVIPIPEGMVVHPKNFSCTNARTNVWSLMEYSKRSKSATVRKIINNTARNIIYNTVRKIIKTTVRKIIKTTVRNIKNTVRNIKNTVRNIKIP